MGGNPSFFNFKKLLTTPLKRSKFVVDLAEACNQVIGKEVEERRRRLERSRDSVKNRKGQIVSHFDYLPEDDKPAFDSQTLEPVTNLTIGETIPQARVLRCVSNIGIYGAKSATDYLEVEFTTKTNQKVRWFMPIEAPQERSLLISNAYLLGFDFYNTTLSDEDYQRLYEFLNMFWPENGLDDKFIKFIGFIKNLKLDLEPLWSQDNGTDKIEVLEEINDQRVKVTDGGDWYLTSHVSINYDLSQQNSIYPIDFHEIERLFYLFAPIMLVLERIVGKLDVFLEVGQAAVPVADVVNYGISERDPNLYLTHRRIAVANTNVTNYGCFIDPDYVPDPDNDLIDVTYGMLDIYIPLDHIAFSVHIQNNTQDFDVSAYVYELVVSSPTTGRIYRTEEIGQIYPYQQSLVVYIPNTDYDISTFSDITYRLSYKLPQANAYELILIGNLIKQDLSISYLDLYSIPDHIDFSVKLLSPNGTVLDGRNYEFKFEFYDTQNVIPYITATMDNALLYLDDTNNYVFCDIAIQNHPLDFTYENSYKAFYRPINSNGNFINFVTGRILPYT